MHTSKMLFRHVNIHGKTEKPIKIFFDLTKRELVFCVFCSLSHSVYNCVNVCGWKMRLGTARKFQIQIVLFRLCCVAVSCALFHFQMRFYCCQYCRAFFSPFIFGATFFLLLHCIKHCGWYIWFNCGGDGRVWESQYTPNEISLCIEYEKRIKMPFPFSHWFSTWVIVINSSWVLIGYSVQNAAK